MKYYYHTYYVCYVQMDIIRITHYQNVHVTLKAAQWLDEQTAMHEILGTNPMARTNDVKINKKITLSRALKLQWPIFMQIKP